MDGDLVKQKIPIFVRLKEFSESGGILSKYLLKEVFMRGMQDAEANFRDLIFEGKVIFLFDGLDEVKKENSYKTITELINFADKYPKNQFIISSRIAAYNSTFEQFLDVEMADFNDQQIQQFVENWFKGSPELAQKCWEKLKINSPIKELAQIPLLLTLVCVTYRSLKNFPNNKAELYDIAINILLVEWDESRLIKREGIYRGLSSKRKKSLLSKIAYETFSQGEFYMKERRLEEYIIAFIKNISDTKRGTQEINGRRILKAIAAQHGLLVPRSINIYSFSHLTFHEFFTAIYLKEHQDYFSEVIDKHIFNYQWREVFLLTVGVMDNADNFFLHLKGWIDYFAGENLVEFLNILNLIIRSNNNGLNRSIAIYFITGLILDHYAVFNPHDKYSAFLDYNNLTDIHLYFACEYAFELARELDPEINHLIELDPDLNLTLNHKFERSFNFDFIDDLEIFASNLEQYLSANKLLIKCLNTGCQISNDLRLKIQDEILTVPENPTV